jgi:hypothetical protein
MPALLAGKSSRKKIQPSVRNYILAAADRDTEDSTNTWKLSQMLEASACPAPRHQRQPSMKTPRPHHLLPLLLMVDASLRIASNTQTIEYTPLLLTSQDNPSTAAATFVSGGVPNLYGSNTVDLATNAETQSLRQYATNKDLRIIYTVCQVSYHIVANKASGINTLSDLKGKRIGTTPDTSAAYFLQQMLATVGLSTSSVSTSYGGTCMAAPCGSGTFPAMLAGRQVDAVAMWEPTGQLSANALSAGQAVIFGGNASIYREVFSLHTTAAHLSNATSRAQIVSFLRAVINETASFANTTSTATSSVQTRVARALGMDLGVLQQVWGIHDFSSARHALPADLLDFLVKEDQWVAQQDNRQAMSRSTLAGLIDPSVLAEAVNGTLS